MPSTVIEARNIPRIPFLPALKDIQMIYDLHGNVQPIAWLPDDHGILVQGRSGPFNSGYKIYDKENKKFRSLDKYLQPTTQFEVSQVASSPYIVFKKSDSKSQLNQLFKFNYISNELFEIFATKSEIKDFLISPNGSQVICNIKLGVKRYQIQSIAIEDKSDTIIIYDSYRPIELIAIHPLHAEILLEETNRDEKTISIYDYTGNNKRILFKYVNNNVYQESYRWSIDGRFLYYLSNKASDFIELHRFDFNLYEDNIITSQINFDVEDYAIFGEDQSVISINSDGFSTIKYYDHNFNGFKELDGLPWGQYEIIQHPSKYLLAVSVSQAYNLKHMFKLSFDKAVTSWEVESIDFDEKGINYERPKTINYYVYDSLDRSSYVRSAYLYKKKDANNDEPMPVLIHLHGGPRGQARPYYGLGSKFLNLGLTIIEPNYRGSSGYGKSFEVQDNGKNRINALKDIGALFDWIAQNPDLDQNRVAVAGSSYGGFLALASMASYPKKIACGLSYYGITDFHQLYRQADDLLLNMLRDEYGDERNQEVNLFLKNISPINNINDLKMPLFVYHGAKDPVVNVHHSRVLVNALEFINEDLWYVEASNEGHGLRDPMNYMYVQNASYLFLKKYLVGSE